jgi:hypothetical protein
MSSLRSDECAVTVARRRTFRERVVAAAMVVFALNLLVLTLLAVGLLAGWVHLGFDRGDVQGQWRLNLTMNTGEVVEDVRETAQETQELAGSLETAAEMNTVIGDVVEKDAAANRLTVQTDQGEKVTARVNNATQVEVEGADATPASIRPGDRVELVFRENEGENYAVKIERQGSE